ncbi:MAG: DUF72 domain-containing protein [Nitrososphaerales archaeon]
MDVKVGCCGLAGLTLSKYAERFNVIEIQSTFYKLPLPETALRWRRNVPDRFEFTMKAFQGLTHPISSPTWRRAGSQKPMEKQEYYGHLQPSNETFECWRKTLHIYTLLKATFCVINLPPSFNKTDENLKRILNFFKDRRANIGIEFRHPSWIKENQQTAEALKAINAVHIVDPFTSKPLIESSIQYFRLHGLGSRPYIYTYSDDDLMKLRKIVQEQSADTVYVMFNNTSMRDDAQRFIKLLHKGER